MVLTIGTKPFRTVFQRCVERGKRRKKKSRNVLGREKVKGFCAVSRSCDIPAQESV